MQTLFFDRAWAVKHVNTSDARAETYANTSDARAQNGGGRVVDVIYRVVDVLYSDTLQAYFVSFCNLAQFISLYRRQGG